MLVNNQLICLLPVRIFNHIILFALFISLFGSLTVKKPIREVVNKDIFVQIEVNFDQIFVKF